MRRAATPGRPRPSRNTEAGGTVVEFAIVLPLFFAMLFGTIDYAWYMYQKFTLASAVQGGLRAALSVRELDPGPGPWATAEAEVKALLGKSGAIPPASVTCGPAVGGQLTGSKPTRALNIECTFVFKPLVGMVKMPSATMTHKATMLLDAQNADI